MSWKGHRIGGVPAAARIAALFFIYGLLWVALSGRVARLIAAGPEALARVHMYMGWAFGAVTAVLMYAVVGRELRKRRSVERDGRATLARRQGPGASAGEAQLRSGRPVRDIDDLEQAERDLKDSEVWWRTVTENLSDAVLVLDADARIRYASPSIERINGHTADERVGGRVFDLVHPDDFSHLTGLIEQVCGAGPRTGDIEVRLRHKDRSWRAVRISVNALLDDPLVAGIVVVYDDVTKRRMLEAELRQAQKMEAIGRLAGGIAHDFNNLMMTVQGYSDLLLEARARDDPDREDLEEIRRAADRATTLAGQLLAFSRKQELASQVVDINEVVSGMEVLIRRLISEDIELVARFDADAAHVEVDPGQLQQVIMNLVVNARDAMPDGGRVAIRTGLATLDARAAKALTVPAQPGTYVVLTVSDTGEGITRENVERVFEPFFTTKTAAEGTGLGLSTVYGIVRQSGGALDLETAVGAGATFRVYLPKVEAAVPAAGPVETPDAPVGRGETILVVEDEAPVRRLVHRMLEAGGYVVLEASDGADALELLAGYDDPLDLLVSDVVMPRIGGLELRDRLQHLRPNTPTIFMSGYPPAGVEALRGEGGEVVLCHKPVEVDDLLRLVRDVLDRASAVRRRRS